MSEFSIVLFNNHTGEKIIWDFCSSVFIMGYFFNSYTAFET